MTRLPCPFCGDDEAAIRLDINDPDHTCTCGNCDEEFTVSAAIKVLTVKLESWQAVAEWADACPIGQARVKAVKTA